MQRSLFAGLLVAAFCLPAAAIEGRYRVEGSMPGGRVYQGEAVVRRDHAVYVVAWQTDLGRHVGTGLRSGPVLAVVYRDQGGREQPGVVAFAIADERIVEGRWTTIGTNQAGSEVWRFIAAR